MQISASLKLLHRRGEPRDEDGTSCWNVHVPLGAGRNAIYLEAIDVFWGRMPTVCEDPRQAQVHLQPNTLAFRFLFALSLPPGARWRGHVMNSLSITPKLLDHHQLFFRPYEVTLSTSLPWDDLRSESGEFSPLQYRKL